MAHVEDPRTAPPIRWGILGAGSIAGTFADAVNRHTRAQLAAVGSRNKDRCERFATAHGIPTTHVGYRDLVEDDRVDAVYVATPHSEHREHALLAIAAGKHVLVEKSFARNTGEAEEVLAAARAAGVFVMEAMWTRFLPHIAKVHQLVDAGEIGEIINISADFGHAFTFNPAGRLFDPVLAGGALLDLGVYPVSFAHDFLGAPDAVRAVGALTETGVDGQASIVLSYGDRVQATLSTTLWSSTPTTASISGTEGSVTIAGEFYRPTSFIATRNDGARWQFDQHADGGMQYEAAEVARRVAAGDTESPRMSWQGTLDVMRTLDAVREQIGVVYPGE